MSRFLPPSRVMRRAVLGFGLAVFWADEGLAQSLLSNDGRKPGHTTHYRNGSVIDQKRTMTPGCCRSH